MTANLRQRLGEARLYLIASLEAPGASRLLPRIARAARAGVSLVQLRAKVADTAARRRLLVEARALLPRATLLIVNDDLDALRDAEGRPLADGVHLGRQDAARHGGLAAARAAVGADLLLGTSVATLDELRAALEGGADHAGFGAIAPSATKHDTRAAELSQLAACLRAAPGFPLFPIGGLGPHNLALVTALGCRRAAVGGAILDAPDPAAAARACLAALDAG